MLNSFVASEIGLVHLAFSILALVLGSYILFTEKGTAIHRKVGYAYAISMLGLNATALMIYRLNGKFGLFHFFAVWGLFSITVGVLAAAFRKPAQSWLTFHYYFMYWSVIGLYAAFGAEMSVRIPKRPFWTMVGVSSGLVSVIGTIIYFKVKGRWDKLAQLYS